VKSSILSGSIDFKDFIWVETLKDELRLAEKVDKPRSFRCSTVIMQIITKEVFGNMISHLMSTREFHGICVGTNPLVDFPIMREKLASKTLKWDADFKEWDGRMLTQVQHMLAEELPQYCVDSDQKKIASFILVNMCHSLVLVMDDLFQTTHSMPSGSFLTAYLNSLVNKCLTAMWYHHTCLLLSRKPSLVEFFKDIVDYLYGDDRVNATNLVGFGAVSMRDYFQSIGLIITDGFKKDIVKDSTPLEDITFLKRSFVFSPRLQRVVCPLSKDTVYSSVSWYDKSKDHSVVLSGKLDALQRELYLHEDYESVFSEIKLELLRRNIAHSFFPESYLDFMLFSNDDNYLMSQNY